MTPERWQAVEEVLQAALDLPSPERAAFLNDACGDDDELKTEAITLIRAHDEAGDFIERPAISEDAYILLGDTIGQEIGPYRILECLGRGGMGEVYLAQDTRLNRSVALKILPAYLAADDDRLQRFQREARTASALNHPNILTIHEVGEDVGVRFIATEFIDGQTLRELIATKSLTPSEVVEITNQIASALSAAHQAGIVHRDIKPENIMRRADGLVKILDFGIAKLIELPSPPDTRDTLAESRVQTEIGAVLGTVNYMSPEQARALAVDERTDLWSLGVVLYEMLSNQLPFHGATRMDTLVSILEREPERLSINPAQIQLQNVVTRALQKDRVRRYQTADEVIADLKLVSNFSAIEKPSVSTLRHRLPLLTIVMLCVLVVSAAIAWKRGVFHRNAVDTTFPPNALVSKVYLQMSEAEQLTFIDEQEQRISTMMGDRPVTLNNEALQAIKRQVDWYVTRMDKSKDLGDQSLKLVFTRAQTHVPLIARSFAARKVPVIIGIYLPVIESAYRDCPETSTGAKGLFQFTPETARQYGVARDEICNVEKMAPAAAHYIADRMAELGEDSQSLTLVLLSYNRGPDRVRDDLRELRDTPDFQRNFWTLFAHRDKLDAEFRNESVGYVPLFFAAAIIGENPHAFDLPTPPLSTLAFSSNPDQSGVNGR